ncbi:hypothetical protein RZS08_26280, partial [Arthrospira platensis SPKY1]|nr:hypothetical protein [Arthrospira platensis SPKY1]
MRHLLEARGCRRVIEIDLKNHVYPRYQSQISDLHLAETLSELMGLDISLPAHADQSTFKIQPFFNSFRSKLQAHPDRFLLFIHQFDVAMSEDAVHFIQFLARMVHSELNNVFLVLAGFEPGLPNDLAPY